MKRQEKSKCPGYKHFFKPVLMALHELGGSGSNDEIYDKIVKSEKLPEEVVDTMHSYMVSELEYKLGWTRTYLKNYGLIENSKQCVWSLTSKGVAVVASGNIDPDEIVRFTNQKHCKDKCVDVSSDDVPAEEKKDWREQIADILQKMNPYAFEKLAQRLLRECGFTEVHVTQKSGDGGIDGVGKLKIKGIFSFNVAFQCKRYKGQVGAPEIRDFRGSLGTNIEKGVLITTGAFTRAAKEEASSEGKRLIDLMDGEEFINKLAEYNIGLKQIMSYEVDEDFFNAISTQ